MVASDQQMTAASKASGKGAGEGALKAAGSVIKGGDLVTTRVRFKTAGQNAANEVTVLSIIKATASCQRATVALEAGSDECAFRCAKLLSRTIPQHLGTFKVRVGALDQDGMAIDYSDPQFTATWDAEDIGIRRSIQCPEGACPPGRRHFFVAEIRKTRRQSLGPHSLVVVLQNGLNERTNRRQNCT